MSDTSQKGEQRSEMKIQYRWNKKNTKRNRETDAGSVSPSETERIGTEMGEDDQHTKI